MRVPSRCWPLRLAAVTPMLAKEGRRLPVSKPATPAGPSNCHLDHHHTGAFIGPVSPTSARGSRPSASLASRRPPTEAATVRLFVSIVQAAIKIHDLNINPIAIVPLG
ncbi:uncharacterized protein LOC131695749 isoform X2 [Topomyia yanbarensis]|uniref:uncharacterized protein LOC131695749 isoform X2 n=1 Tax=Topomyia yanbarensis TaxID=2498891 RepID=UPI00273CE09F|nr:uncharacterized protein LOC131695749 isoform X2 [Topomyia yanbarensis]